MRIAFKLIGWQRTSQNGVVMLAALMAVLILTVVGFFALTTSGDDIQIAARVISEEQALSAAESGVHATCTSYLTASNFNGQPALADLPPTSSIGGDTRVSYGIVGFNKISVRGAIGSNIAGGNPWQTSIYFPVITGTYGANRVQIQVGILDYVPKATN